MPTPRQSQFIDQLNTVIGQIAMVKPEQLEQREKLGSALSFEAAIPVVAEIVTAAQGLQKANLNRIPYATLNQLVNYFLPIRDLLAQVLNFSPASHGNAIQARDSLTNTLEEHWNNMYLVVRSVLGNQDNEATQSEIDRLTAQVRTSVQLSSEAADALRGKQQEIDKNLEKFLNDRQSKFDQDAAKKIAQIDDALQQVRNAAVEAGVSQTSTHFSVEAESHRIASNKWLGATAGSIVLLVAFSLFGTQLMTFLGIPEPGSDAGSFTNLRYLAQKGMIIFCLIFALIMCAKNYGAARHNYVVNKHRNNALSSFQAFSASAADPQTKSAVLIQATQSVFAPQTSGYVKADGDNSPQTPVIEILRSIGGKDT